MTSLNDSILNNVSGGIGRGKEARLVVTIDLTKYHFEETITIKPYLDGVLCKSLVKTIDPLSEFVTLNFSGYGVKRLKVKLNNLISRYYILDFDQNLVTEENF